MKHYGTSHRGNIIVESIDVLPAFCEYDIGRMVFVKDENSLYVGTNTGWDQITGSKFINLNKLNLGTGRDDLNASNILIRNINEYFKGEPTIEDVLNDLHLGIAIKDGVISTRHIANHSITLQKLSLGTTSITIGAQTLPYLHPKTKEKINISSVLDNIITNYPTICNKQIKIQDWDFDSVSGLFCARFNYIKSSTDYPLIQCYDENGYMFTPSRLYHEIGSNKWEIWVPYKMNATLVIVG